MKPTEQELLAHSLAIEIVEAIEGYISDVARGRAIADLAQFLEGHRILASLNTSGDRTETAPRNTSVEPNLPEDIA